MIDFKVGDEVWQFWVSCEGMSVGFVAKDLNLVCEKTAISTHDLGFYNKDYYWKRMHKSKNEAIDAIIKRLESMREE